jgi:uncharacterized 2Fe-2S/4Fe-4S cluster protein (DUF4445 family)
MIEIELLPLGTTVPCAPGTPLQELLFPHGVEFPCGGRGLCKGCKVRVLRGDLPITAEDRARLNPADLEAGWRLACRARAVPGLAVELAQWEADILTDNTSFAFTPREGLGVAIDIGTTTIVAQLLDLRNGNLIGVRTALNPQARHGADIMSRIEFATTGAGQGTLQQLIRSEIASMIGGLLASADSHARGSLRDVVLVGNTVMHHLFCGIDVEPLSHFPFEPQDVGLRVFTSQEMGWDLPAVCEIRFLPCLGGFVGSDILAGILATRLDESDDLVALMDLGTNGEIVVGNRHRLLCASTAAGPAFEGARISCGMRAATGAIAEVKLEDGRFACRVLGGGPPRGLCGSGLVDAVAAGLDLGAIHPTGRLLAGEDLLLADPVKLHAWDIRELQLAKGAIAAGLEILLGQWGAAREDLRKIYLAGAFGNYISRASAQRIGLLKLPLEKVEPVGNSALLGAKLALFHLTGSNGDAAELRAKTRHVSIHEDPAFHETYVLEMGFPAL